MKTIKQQFIDGMGWGIIAGSLLGSFLLVLKMLELGAL